MNSNLIQLLTKTKATELKTIVQFAKSPFHNSNKLIIKLLEELLNYYPDFKHKRLTKEIIFRKIHSEGTEYHDGRMNLLMTQLVKLIERFYMYQEFEQDEFLRKKMQGRGFWKRNFEGKFKKLNEKNLITINSQNYADEDYFLNKYSIHQDLLFKTVTQSNYNDQNLLLAIDNLDQFYLASKLKLNIELITRKLFFSKQRNDIISNELLLKIKSNFKENLLIRLYHNITSLRTTEQYQEKLFDTTKKLFEENIHKFNFDTKKIIYFNLSNYIIQHYTKGNINKYTKGIELFKVGEKHNLILNNNAITPISYLNMATQGIAEKEYDWSMRIILDYAKYLPPKEANDIKNQMLAFWYLYKGNELPKNYASFYKVLELMRESKIKNKDPRMTFRNKSILIRTYYELISDDRSFSNLLESELLSFEQQLNNDTIMSDAFINHYLVFIGFVRQLSKVKLNRKKELNKIKEIQNSFLRINTIPAKKWINEKIEELLSTPQSKKS